MIKIIAFCGAPGAGKDTAADYLVENHDFAHVKFARELREICAHSFGLPLHYLADPAFKDKKFEHPIVIDEEDYERFTNRLNHNFVSSGNYKDLRNVMIGKELETPRELLQYIGTDVIRQGIDASYFVSYVEDKIRYWESRGSNVVISDLRFPNELKAIKKHECKAYRILRDVGENGHAAENQELDVDGEVCNNGSVRELELQLEELL